MTKYLGVAMIVLATILLVISYCTETLTMKNWWQILSMIILIAGVVVHVITLKKS